MLSVSELYPFISALLALTMVILVTVIGERWGTRIGGLVGTIPFLLLIALIFIGLSGGPERAGDSATIVIVEMGANITFLSVYLLTLHKGMARAITLSMSVWAVISYLILVSGGFGTAGNSLLYFFMLVVNLALLRRIGISSRPMKLKYSAKELSFRGLLGGTAIGTAVFLSKVGGPVIGGIFAIFPAIFLSTMIIYSLKHDIDVPRAMGKSMTLGSLNVFSYALTASLTFPVWGIWLGTISSLSASIITSLLLLRFTRRNLR